MSQAQNRHGDGAAKAWWGGGVLTWGEAQGQDGQTDTRQTGDSLNDGRENYSGKSAAAAGQLASDALPLSDCQLLVWFQFSF